MAITSMIKEMGIENYKPVQLTPILFKRQYNQIQKLHEHAYQAKVL